MTIEDALKDILEHHGIKGQKWGVRTRSGGSDHHTKSISELHKAPSSEDASRAAAAKDKIKIHGTHALSNQELQHLVNRMNLEQQFSRLSSQNKKTITEGHNKVKQILGVAKTLNEIHTFVKSPLVTAIKTALKDKQ